jgi:hypothetical protein
MRPGPSAVGRSTAPRTTGGGEQIEVIASRDGTAGSASANWSDVDLHPRVNLRLDTDDLLASVVDPARFGRVFERNFEPVRRYAARRLGVRLADDVAAETFARAFRSRTSFNPLGAQAFAHGSSASPSTSCANRSVPPPAGTVPTSYSLVAGTTPTTAGMTSPTDSSTTLALNPLCEICHQSPRSAAPGGGHRSLLQGGGDSPLRPGGDGEVPSLEGSGAGGDPARRTAGDQQGPRKRGSK